MTVNMSDKESLTVLSEETGELTKAGVIKPASTSTCFTLTVQAGTDFGRVFQLIKAETIIGRSESSDIILQDGRTSRSHLLITQKVIAEAGKPIAKRFTAIDLGSKNGTYVNHKRITEIELFNKDRLEFGDTILQFEIKDSQELVFHQQLYDKAMSDALTGLWNRSYAQNELTRLIENTRYYQRPFSILLLDIDLFKGVNDSYGHDIGDIVLQKTAQSLIGQLQRLGIAARYGGEEFLVLLPDTGIAVATIIAERLRQAVEEIDFAMFGYPKRITISIGVGEFPSCGCSEETLIKNTDNALYHAKQTGRNKVCLATQVTKQQ